MEPEIPNDQTLLTTGDLAKRLNRSRYGVKKAIQRLGIAPERELAGMSFYHPSIEAKLGQGMRGPNLQTLQK